MHLPNNAFSLLEGWGLSILGRVNRLAAICTQIGPWSFRGRSRAVQAAVFGFVLSAGVAGASPGVAAQEKDNSRGAPRVMGDEEGEEYERNRRWFLEQRTYPFTSIPSDGRRRAFEELLDYQRRTAATRSTSRLKPESGARGQVPVWRSIGPAPTIANISQISPVSGRLRAVVISPADPNVILVGSTSGGIWRSTDAGQTFVPVSDNQVDLSVGAIAFAPSDPNIVYAAMGQEYLGSGVLKSTDAGRTWVRVSNSSLPTPGISRDIDVDPANPNRVYVTQYAGQAEDGQIFSSGFFVSTDGGVNWTRTLTGLALNTVINVSDAQTLYLSMQRVDEGDDRPPGIYRSQDGGQSWALLYTGPFSAASFPTFQMSATAADVNRIYAYGVGQVGNVRSSRVSVSTNAGASWQELEVPALPQQSASYIVADPVNPMRVYVGYPGGDVFKSTDGGRTWTCLSMGYCDGAFGDGDRIHVDQHALAIVPNAPDTIYCGNDGGLYRSQDAGTNWTSLNQTLSLVTFRGITINPINPLTSYGGTQDNGTQRRLANTTEWHEIITGDGGPVVFVPSDPSTYFTTYIFGTVFRWRNERFDKTVSDSETFGETGSVRIAFYPPFSGDGSTNRLYFGTWRLFVSDNKGDSWSAPAGTKDLTKGAQSFDVLLSIGVSTLNPQVIFTGSAQGRAMVSSDAGRTWKDVTAGLPDRAITSITVDRANPDVAYLTVSGYRSGHVFKTTNRGDTWTNIGVGVPDIPCNALMQDPMDANILYLGTDIGAFRSTNAGANWEYFSNGMPPAIVLGFASHPIGIVQLATYGRGAYELGSDVILPDYTLSFDQSEITVQRGKSATLVANITRIAGFAEEVTITGPDTKPIKFKLKPASGSTTGDSLSFKLKVKKAAQPGNRTLTFAARSTTGVEHSANVTVVVQ